MKKSNSVTVRAKTAIIKTSRVSESNTPYKPPKPKKTTLSREMAARQKNAEVFEARGQLKIGKGGEKTFEFYDDISRKEKIIKL